MIEKLLGVHGFERKLPAAQSKTFALQKYAAVHFFPQNDNKCSCGMVEEAEKILSDIDRCCFHLCKRMMTMKVKLGFSKVN